LCKALAHFVYTNKFVTNLAYTSVKPFQPQPLPIKDVKWEELIPELGEANRAISRYAGVLHAIPNPNVLLSPLRTQEAVLSSAIEGTQATLGEVLKFEVEEEEKEDRKRHDIQEILNYRKALFEAEEELNDRPFNLNLLLGLHSLLLDSVRGRDKGRGHLRTVQNWIGSSRCSIDEAHFVPPPPDLVPVALHQWEKYYHSTEKDPLAQLAVVHAQFEIIHPFVDGNGRLGRIIIPLFLFEKKLLHRPMFYLSAWLEKNRDDYVERLRVLGRSPGAWNDWIRFFLRGIAEQSGINADKALAVKALYEELKLECLKLTHSQFAVPLLDRMFQHPFFYGSAIKLPENPSRQSVSHLLSALSRGGIIEVARRGQGRRPTIYALRRLISLCET
jgi:Fic family protein